MKRYLTIILISINYLLLIFLTGLVIYINFFRQKSEEVIIESVEKGEPIIKEEVKSQIAVEVKGAVANPGVYFFEEGAIIDNLIEQAGGLDYNAYTKNINFSKKLLNEMVIYVYTNYEYSQIDKKEEKEETPVCNCPEVNIEPCLESGVSIIIPQENDNQIISTEDNTSNLVNINTASLSELMSLSGIGEAKAKSIISYREINGNFASIEDIKNVSGISDNIYEKIKDYITI